MRRFLLIGDIHYGFKSNQSRYLDVTDDVMNRAAEVAKEKDVDKVIFLGDYFDNRNTINVKTLIRGVRTLKKVAETVPVILIPGNHDYYYRITKDYLSLEALGLIDENIKVVNEMTAMEADGVTLLLVPWLMPDDVPKFQRVANSGKFQICLGHFEIVGFELNVQGFVNQAGFHKEELSQFRKVYTGHFHKRQTKDNITYIGSPYEIDFGEAGDTKGFTILHLPSSE
jgi:DNA repair exonuclease SbcCD nuclease subunit